MSILDSKGNPIVSPMEAEILEAIGRQRKALARSLYASTPEILDYRGSTLWREPDGRSLAEWLP